MSDNEEYLSEVEYDNEGDFLIDTENFVQEEHYSYVDDENYQTNDEIDGEDSYSAYDEENSLSRDSIINGEDDDEIIIPGQNDHHNRITSLHELLGVLTSSVEARRSYNSNSSQDRLNDTNLPSSLPEYREVFDILNNNFHINKRVLKLVDNIKDAEKDTYLAMESLREISEQLLMTNPLTIERRIPQTKLLDGIMTILTASCLEHELELQMSSCRCMYNLFEINSNMITVAIEKGIINVLQRKIKEMNYIDLGEQILEILELISRTCGYDILTSNTLVSCLQYLDFFTIHAQRKAVAIFANSCASVQITDYKYVVEVFPLLKNIFLNTTDQIILTKILDAIYGICVVLFSEYEKLENLFDLDIINKICSIISVLDIDLDGKIKSLDILSLLVSCSTFLTEMMIKFCDIPSMLCSCFNGFKKASHSVLHEILMFVPKSLLLTISRFVVLLLPAEIDQILTIDKSKKLNISSNDHVFTELIKNLTQIMIDIYLSSLDFEIRRHVLMAFSRMASSINYFCLFNRDDSIIGIISLTLTQNIPLFIDEKKGDIFSGNLLVEVLFLASIMIKKFTKDAILPLKREGFHILLKSFKKELCESVNTIVELHTCQNKNKLSDEKIVGEMNKEEYGIETGNVGIKNEIAPTGMMFQIFKNLDICDINHQLLKLCTDLVDAFDSYQEIVVQELQDAEKLAIILSSTDINNKSEEYWDSIWSSVNNTIFKSDFTISGFEFVSTGLADCLYHIIQSDQTNRSICHKSFIKILGDKLGILVNILQSSLTRLEPFKIIEPNVDEKMSQYSSLRKQIKLKLVYDGDPILDHIPRAFSIVKIDIHCIASFAVLNDLLRNRITQSQFLDSIFPRLVSTYNQTPNSSNNLKHVTFQFQLDSKPINYTSTIFGIIYRHMISKKEDPSKMWINSQVIHFKRTEVQMKPLSLQQSYHHDKLDSSALEPVEGILALLSYAKTPQLSKDIFINSKMSAKLARQLEEPLIVAGGILPSWTLKITKNYPFLFPFETRMFFLQSTSFGYTRLLQLWRSKTMDDSRIKNDDALSQMEKISRHKLRISRKTLFSSALKVLEKYGASPSLLEIEYQDEEGTGLGPTLEFYASVSKEFTQKSLSMWRFDDYSTFNDDLYLEDFLFPAPLNEENTQILELFEHLGTFIARSMLDNRIVDFRFNKTFFELLHRRVRNEPFYFTYQEQVFNILDLIDRQLSKSLQILASTAATDDIECLSLNFTLPGYGIELVKNGENIAVSKNNVYEYIEHIFNLTFGTGIVKQLDSFISGFSKVFPYKSLLILSPEEISELLGVTEEDWSEEILYSCVNADHGYNMDSMIIHDLICTMNSFSIRERRLFLQFLTGSPRLPMGGFKNLKPKLTVVLKIPENDRGPDEYLPSVMTCANYLKLPKYSNREILYSRISQAMTEGSGAFLLS